jgi:hypothetical protein
MHPGLVKYHFSILSMGIDLGVMRLKSYPGRLSNGYSSLQLLYGKPAVIIVSAVY